jgi:predicted transcriptional regulator
MSLITDEKREELRNESIEELVKIIKKTRPRIDEEYAISVAKQSKPYLSKDRFWVLSDPEKTVDQKANDLGLSPGTVMQGRSFLVDLGAIKSYQRAISENVFRQYLSVIDEIGPCAIKEVAKKLKVEFYTASSTLKRLEKQGMIKRIKPPENCKGMYDFFSALFTKRGSYLIFNPNSKNNLEKLTERLIGCIPAPLYPWLVGRLGDQLNELRKNGLPVEVYKTAKDSYSPNVTHEVVTPQTPELAK